MAYSGPMEDKLAIRELIETYSDIVNRLDRNDLITLWTDDATWFLLGQTITGKPAIQKAWDGALERIEYVSFLSTPAAIEVEGNSAKSRSYIKEQLQLKDGSSRNIDGCYEDEFTRIDGKWLFSKRSYKVLRDF